jgi:hypothetical protein
MDYATEIAKIIDEMPITELRLFIEKTEREFDEARLNGSTVKVAILGIDICTALLRLHKLEKINAPNG